MEGLVGKEGGVSLRGNTVINSYLEYFFISKYF